MKLFSKFTELRMAVFGWWCVGLVVMMAVAGEGRAQGSLGDGLVAYWPMDVVTNGVTPDLVHGYDLILNNVAAGNFVPATRNGGHLGTQSTVSAGNAVSFTNAQHGFLYYPANAGDLLPINLQSNYTVNFWINVLGTNQNNLTVFAEDDLGGSSNPLWVAGTGGSGGSSEDNHLHWLRRQQSISINGVAQSPDINEAEGAAFTAANPLDGAWHMVTITKQFTNNVAGSNCENFEVYVDAVRDAGSGVSMQVDAAGNPAVLTPEPWTNSANPNAKWSWLINATSFGGTSRTLTGSGFLTGQMDDAAIWNRPLSAAEILGVYENGLVQVMSVVTATIATFAPDAHEVLPGDTVALRWNTAHANSLTLSPGIGEVLQLGTNGSGSVNVTITSNATFTLAASRMGSSVTNTATLTVTVAKQPVAANWHLLENFDGLPTGAGPGIPAVNWETPLSDFGAQSYFDVSSLTQTNGGAVLVNQVAGTAHQPGGAVAGAISAYLLNGLTVQTNASNTLFFRVYIQATNSDDFSFFLGMNDLNLQPLAVALYDDFNVGPRINIQRTLSGTGGVIDVLANDGVAGYDVVENGGSVAAGTRRLSTTVPGGLAAGTVYDFWVDVVDQPFGVSTNGNGTTNTSGTLYSVYYKAAGAAERTEMFTNLLSDRSPFGTSPAPLAALGQVFLELDSQAHNPDVVVTGTNTIVVDDLYLSRTNLNGMVPVARGFFPNTILPASITLGEPAHLAADPANGNRPSTTLRWASVAGATYTVYRTGSLTGGWELVATELASGGAMTVYKDAASAGAGEFYKVTSP